VLPNTRLHRTRRPRFRAGRSLRSLGSPVKRCPLGVRPAPVSANSLGYRFVGRKPLRFAANRMKEESDVLILAHCGFGKARSDHGGLGLAIRHSWPNDPVERTTHSVGF
jgi:hypothetical protein